MKLIHTLLLTSFLSRTSRDSDNFHDADLATFHRVRNFRSLSMDIRPKL